MTRAFTFIAVGVAIAAVTIAACSSGPAVQTGLACAPDLTPSCGATYDPPAFETIYTKIFAPTCATGNGTCHTDNGRKAGLAFVTDDEAYELLLGTGGGKKRVVPGDYQCSLLIERLTSKNPDLHMPPGPNSLSAGDLCTIVKWIANGAPR
jgi:hypothetical protein